MEELNTPRSKQQKINLTNRKNAFVSGVSDVISFDPNEILLETELGMLMVKGKNLHVKRLSLEKGEVDLDGMVDSLTYSEGGHFEKSQDSFWSRLWK